MTTTWVTSDQHFGHANIIQHCKRPFKNTADMDAALIDAWNSVVQPKDLVWHLGDMFSFKAKEMDVGYAAFILGRLNGQIHVLKGNHDNQDWFDRLGITSARPYVELRRPAPTVLFHYPIDEWNGQRHGSVHLHGHTHGQSQPRKNRLDIGVDCHEGFRPVSLEIAVEMARANGSD